jgi:hypothetical protein
MLFLIEFIPHVKSAGNPALPQSCLELFSPKQFSFHHAGGFSIQADLNAGGSRVHATTGMSSESLNGGGGANYAVSAAIHFGILTPVRPSYEKVIRLLKAGTSRIGFLGMDNK